MRRLVAALVILGLALTLVGCGGGGASSSTVTPPPSGSAAPPAPAASPVSAAQSQNTLSPQFDQTGTAFPAGPATPQATRDRLKNKMPMLVYLFDPNQLTTADQGTAITNAIAKYRGLIDLVQFDVSSPLTGSSTAGTPGAQQTAALMQELNVNFTPYLVFVDSSGIITKRFNGFVDEELIEREILRATQD